MIVTNPSSWAGFPAKACHNCRRRRRRCDRSQPTCHKCSRDGEVCLGYGQLLRWANVTPATRARPAPQPLVRGESNAQSGGGGRQTTADTVATCQDTALVHNVQPSLIDPLLSGMSERPRFYIHHFANVVCPDLVSVDQLERNPFRRLILLVEKYDYLKAIVLATASMHLTVLHRHQGRPSQSDLVYALSAKAKAISLLRAALTDAPSTDEAVLLAAIVFFINLDLIDSGRGGWKAHIQAAGTLISSLQRAQRQLDSSLQPLADAIAADCLTYRIFGSTIGRLDPVPGSVSEHINVLSVLQSAEAHSYHCCPPFILQTTMAASRMFDPEFIEQDDKTRMSVAESLLAQARTFDIERWVYGIRGLSEEDDLPVRVQLASAHRAACCLYILLAVSRGDSKLPDTWTQPDDVVLEIFNHLSQIPIDHVLLKGTVWPTFLVGAQTDDPLLRSLCLDRLHAILNTNAWMCPWGYIYTAIEMLQDIWASKDRVAETAREMNWLQELKSLANSALIV
ncbi:acriflavine sensitivity control protein acr-2 [Apodospora peruviana]|uniref:Acriflavine sensitivity control protein acr-2 n=1 Tax=Apodospora peruviana TaxID=516989 RepID=A0AAE0HUS0_9PEZI|nr:acriflavine sensitivity control protein acr-2 [Apodospora peruviana]